LFQLKSTYQYRVHVWSNAILQHLKEHLKGSCR